MKKQVNEEEVSLLTNERRNRRVEKHMNEEQASGETNERRNKRMVKNKWRNN